MLSRLKRAARRSTWIIGAASSVLAVAALFAVAISFSSAVHTQQFDLYPETRSLLEWRSVPNIKIYPVKMAGLQLELPVFATLSIEKGTQAKPTEETTDIGFTIFLPGFHPVGPSNIAEYRRPGWGNKLRLDMKPISILPAADSPLRNARGLGASLPYVELPESQLAQETDRRGNIWHYRYAADGKVLQHVSRCDGDRDSVRFKGCWTFLVMWDRVSVSFEYSADHQHDWQERDRTVRALLGSFLASEIKK